MLEAYQSITTHPHPPNQHTQGFQDFFFLCLLSKLGDYPTFEERLGHEVLQPKNKPKNGIQKKQNGSSKIKL